MIKRVSMFVCVIMCLVSFNVVNAANITVGLEESDYKTIKEAVENSTNGDTITLQKNVSIKDNGGLTITKETILDLNGFEIEALNGSNANITVRNTKLTINDSSNDKTGKIISKGHIDSSNNGGRGVIDVENSDLILNAGSIEVTGNGHLNGVLAFYGTKEDFTTVTVNGGSISAPTSAIANHNIMSGNTEFIVNGGKINGGIYSGYLAKYHNHDVTINGGIVDAITLGTSAAYAYANGIVPKLTIGTTANLDNTSVKFELYNNDLAGNKITDLFNCVSSKYEIVLDNNSIYTIESSEVVKLNKAKEDKIKTLQTKLSTYKKEEYSSVNYDIIVKTFNDVIESVKNCKTIDEVAKLDATVTVKTLAEELKEAKELKIKTLDETFATYGKDRYTSENYAKLTKLFEDAKKAVNNATTAKEVENVKVEVNIETIEDVEIKLENKNELVSNVETNIPKDVFTKEEIASGKKLSVELDLEEVELDKLSDTENKLITSKIDSNNKLGMILDIDLLKTVGNNKVNITNLNKKITLTVNIPKALQNADKEYYIVRIHNGEVQILKDTDDNMSTITFETDRFSTYALMYTDNNKESDFVENPNTGKLETNKKSTVNVNNIIMFITIVAAIASISFIKLK